MNLAYVRLEQGRYAVAAQLARKGRELLTGVVKLTYWMNQFADAAVGVALVSNGQRKEVQAILDPVQKLFEKNKAGGWRTERVRRWSKRSSE